MCDDECRTIDDFICVDHNFDSSRKQKNNEKAKRYRDKKKARLSEASGTIKVNVINEIKEDGVTDESTVPQ
jgi:hypothetical protein